MLHRFAGSPDGRFPEAGLVLGSDGALYGTTREGGHADVGTVFKLTPPVPPATEWTETVLYAFGGPDGRNPVASLVFGADGALYGTTYSGGASNFGTVFKLTLP